MTLPHPQAAANPADHHNTIRVHGARENNLKNLTLALPKRRLTVVTGVSGSGKSSLVFATIAAESQRMINETYPAFVQGFMPQLPRPDVELLSGITPVIAVDQSRLGGDPRSTVGTVTEVHPLLRIIFSRLGTPQIGGPQSFSFNLATVRGVGSVKVEKAGRTVTERREFARLGGMCARCEGRGTVSDFDLSALLNRELSIANGAILVPGYSMDGWYGRIYNNTGFFNAETPVSQFTSAELDALLYQAPTKIVVDGINVTFEGLIPKIQKSMLSKDRDAMQPHIRAFVDRAIAFATCPDCDGTRLNDEARSVTVAGRNIAEVCRLPLTEVAGWITQLATLPEAAHIAPLLSRLNDTVTACVDIGLGYLTLERPAGTLSGGEAQRTKMIRHLGSSLTDITYVFDEPSVGLHPHDLERLNRLLLRLRDLGNTVLIVEHHPDVIRIADHIIDLGPGAGTQGGDVCFDGSAEAFRDSGTLTAQHLAQTGTVKPAAAIRTPSGSIEVRGAHRNNLCGVDVDVPLGVLTVVTGVAGSGKSSLIHGSISHRPDVRAVDQSPLGGSRRSTPATYAGVLDPIRTAFAKANGVKPALFSANSAGACPECSGSGVITTDLGVMASIDTVCEVCEGRRFADEVLQYRLSGKNIVEVLALSISDAHAFFTASETSVPKAAKLLAGLVDVGLGYIALGQTLTTLSGGERQRLKLALALTEDSPIIVLDEPTAGLHPADVARLLALFDRLVDAGRTLIVIEHSVAVMAHADYLIDVGPGAGTEGGTVVFTGSPAALVADPRTITGQYLARYVSA